MRMQAFGKKPGGGGSAPSKRLFIPKEHRVQERADRLRRAAGKLDDAASELAANEGAGIVIKLAHDLRQEAKEIEQWLPSE